MMVCMCATYASAIHIHVDSAPIQRHIRLTPWLPTDPSPNCPAQAMDYFGASLAGIGDVDGDGMEDMVVGALGDDEAALNAGTPGDLGMR